jgi:hypothetical protein
MTLLTIFRGVNNHTEVFTNSIKQTNKKHEGGRGQVVGPTPPVSVKRKRSGSIGWRKKKKNDSGGRGGEMGGEAEEGPKFPHDSSWGWTSGKDTKNEE